MFSVGGNAEPAPVPRTPRPPPSDVRFSFGEPASASARRGSSRFDNGPPAAGPPAGSRRDPDLSRREPDAARREPEPVRKAPESAIKESVDLSDPEAVRRAQVQAERHAALLGRQGSTDSSTSSTSTSASVASGAPEAAAAKRPSTTPGLRKVLQNGTFHYEC